MKKFILVALVALSILFSTPAQAVAFGDMGLVPVSSPAKPSGVEIRKDVTYCCSDTILTITVRISPAVVKNLYSSPLVLSPTPDGMHQLELKTSPLIKVEYGTSPYLDTFGSAAEIGILFPGSVTAPGWQPYAYNKSAISATSSGTMVFSIGGGGSNTIVPGQPLILTTGQPLSPLTGDSYVTIRISCYLRRAL